MHAMSATRYKHSSRYNDLKVDLHKKLKYSLQVCLFELRFIIIARYIAAIKVKTIQFRRLFDDFERNNHLAFFYVNDCIIRRCLFTLSFH